MMGTTELSASYARELVDVMVGYPDENLRDIGGELTSFNIETQTYHTAIIYVSLPTGVEFSDSRILDDKYDCEEVKFENSGVNDGTPYTYVTVDTPKGKLGVRVRFDM